MTEILNYEDRTEGNVSKIQLVDANTGIEIWITTNEMSDIIYCGSVEEGRTEFVEILMRINNEVIGGQYAGNI